MNNRLWEFGQQMLVDNKFQAVLKLAYLRKSLKHEEIDESEYSKMCRKCLTPWSVGFFTVAVVPKCKRIYKKIEELESKNHLTKQQKSLVKYLKTRAGRVAKYTCQMCSYKTRIPLDVRVKWPEPNRTTPAPVSKADEFKARYNKWIEETQTKKKRHGKSTAGLKIPPKPTNSTGNGVRAQGNNSSADKNWHKHFKPTDFKLIQQLLAASVASKTDNKPNQKPTANQPVGRLRLSRN